MHLNWHTFAAAVAALTLTDISNAPRESRRSKNELAQTLYFFAKTCNGSSWTRL